MPSKGFRWTLLIIAGIILISALVIRGLPRKPSDKVITERFQCGRLTLDYRDTDQYCADPDYYRSLCGYSLQQLKYGCPSAYIQK